MLRRDNACRPAPEKRVENNASPAPVVVFAFAGRFVPFQYVDTLRPVAFRPAESSFRSYHITSIRCLVILFVRVILSADIFASINRNPRRTAMRTRFFRRPSQNARFDKVRREHGEVGSFKGFSRDGPDGALVAAERVRHRIRTAMT